MDNPRRIFVSHASSEKDLARDVARQLDAMGFEAWLDEAELVAAAEFPKRLTEALAASTHLLVVLTAQWLRRHWTRRELEVFSALHPDRAKRIVALLPEPIDPENLPESLRDRVLVDAAELDREERAWRLYCAIERQQSGPRDRWRIRARQVVWTQGEAPELSRIEVLDATRVLLDGGGAPSLVRNVILHCLREGVSPRWLEAAVGDPVEMYGLALDSAPKALIPALWTRLAECATGEGRRPANLDEARLVRTVVESEDEPTAVAATRLLSIEPLGPQAVRTLTTWLDPDAAPYRQDGPQSRDHVALIDAALELLFAQPQVDPLALFCGFGSVWLGEPTWWTRYFARLLDAAEAGQVPWEAVAKRLDDGLEMSEENADLLDAICRVLGERPFDSPLDGVAQRALRRASRLRGPRWNRHVVAVAERIVERHHRAVFLRLGASLSEFDEWPLALRAARLTGLAAQTADTLAELLGRFQYEREPELRALLFEAAMESPSEISEPARAAEPIAGADAAAHRHAMAAAIVHDGSQLRALQTAIETDTWREAAGEWLASQPSETRRRWLYVLARECVHADVEPARCWTILRRSLALSWAELARAGAPHVTGDRRAQLEALEASDDLDAMMPAWDEATGTLLGLGRDLVEHAERVHGRLRWLQTCLGRPSPSALGPAAPLKPALREWFIENPSALRRIKVRPGVCFRHAPTATPSWLTIRRLLDESEIGDVLEALLDGSAGAEATREALIEAIDAFEAADRAKTVSHGLMMIEEILGWAVRWLQTHPQPGGEGFLWSMLHRSHGMILPIETEGRRHANTVAALAVAYRSNVPAMLESLTHATVDDDTRMRVLIAACATDPTATETPLVSAVGAMSQQPGTDDLVVDALAALACHHRTCAVPLLRRLVGDGRSPQVRGAAAAALVALSAHPDDRIAALHIALSEPASRAVINAAVAL